MYLTAELFPQKEQNGWMVPLCKIMSHQRLLGAVLVEAVGGTLSFLKYSCALGYLKQSVH